jgi:hypothetical protein
MSMSYQVTIDVSDDESYGLDISADVLAIAWRLGMAHPYAPIADPAEAEITLVNRAGQHNSYPTGQRVRIQSVRAGGSPVTHFVGAIDRVQLTTGSSADHRAVLTCYGRARELDQQAVTLPLLLNISADAALRAIIERVRLRYPALAGYCIIDVAGYNDLGATPMIFPALPLSLAFEAGKSTFAYVGDVWTTTTSAYAAIRDVVASEGGRFFFDRTGRAVFYNRHHAFVDTPQTLSIDDDVLELGYDYGAGVMTQVETTLTPRRIGAQNRLLWQSEDPIAVPQDVTQVLTVRYSIDNRTISALSVQNPLPYIHYRANTRADGQGLDVTDALRVALRAESNSRGGMLELDNPTRFSQVYVTQLELRGTPLLSDNPLTITARDTVAETFYGVRRQRLRLPLLSDSAEAQAAVTDALLQQRQVRGIVHHVTTDTHTHAHAVQTLTLFDRLQITEAHSGHSADYRIIAEAHQVRAGGAQHRVTWTLEPDDSAVFIVVDTSWVNGAQRLRAR